MARFREVSILFVIGFHCLAAEKTPHVPRSPDVAPELRVTVNVYNGTNLPTDELDRAEREAERIFRYAGIQLAWGDGLMGSDDHGQTRQESWDPLTLQLRIWPRTAAGTRPSGADTLGFCLSFESSDAVVLADTVQKHVVPGSPAFADLLGIAMAHELGHLLLQSARHSVSGIMRSHLSERTRRDDERGYLRFTSWEAEFMRKQILRRMKLKSEPY